MNLTEWIGIWSRFDPRYLAPAFATYSLALLAAAYAWHRIIAATTGLRNLRRDVKIYVVSAVARRLPGSLWGPALRMYWYRRFGGDWRSVGLASVLEMWATALAGAILGLAGAVLFIGPSAGLTTWIGLGLAALLLGSLFVPRINDRLVAFIARLLKLPVVAPPTESSNQSSSGSNTTELARWTAIEMLNWLCGGMVLAAVLRALTPYPSHDIPRIVTSWAAAGTVGTLITFVPGGLGVVELSLTGLLAFFISPPVALAGAIGLRVFLIASELVWCIAGIIVPPIFGGLRSLLRQKVRDQAVVLSPARDCSVDEHASGGA